MTKDYQNVKIKECDMEDCYEFVNENEGFIFKVQKEKAKEIMENYSTKVYSSVDDFHICKRCLSEIGEEL